MKQPTLPHRSTRAARGAAWLAAAALMALVTACDPAQSMPPAAPATVAPAGLSAPLVGPGGRLPSLIWRQLSMARPQPAASGAIVTVNAVGGYFSCGLSGVDESSHSFDLKLDGQPVGGLACYVNHCEA